MVDGSRVNQLRRPVACRYVAAVPELSAGLPRIPGLPWALQSHRQVLAELATGGVGDWAVALRSPEGTVVARVFPFDPAYRAFVDLCRQCAGNRWLPRIELAAGLEGGGSVVFLEFVAPVDHPVHGQFAGQWRARAGDAEFQKVRRAAQRIDAQYRESTPWWGRCDLDDAHIFRPESVSRAATRRSRFLRSWLPAGIVGRDSAGSSRKESHPDGDGIRYAGPDPRQDTGRGGRPVADGGGRDARCHRTVRQARPDRGPR